MKRSLAVFLILWVWLVSAQVARVHAVQGELRYDLPVSQDAGQTVVTDTGAIENCKQELTSSDTLLKNCQDANGIINSTVDVLKGQKNMFFWLSIGNGILAVSLGIICVLLVVKLKKAQVPPPSI
jgi:hypothetical protein